MHLSSLSCTLLLAIYHFIILFPFPIYQSDIHINKKLKFVHIFEVKYTSLVYLGIFMNYS